ncbi:hypothetical protein ARMGADRAFT_1077820 [Armillaria gallica]|uniref:Peptidase C14 caspase domain-containing protein n=1 Tax=Armillaria gallica TaxID=47427 RepID=A0A2H3DLV6_ARMGA|nr:hypothetical protein ARMGADRAFT_1077820 [Armillaria gallica]
MSLADLFFNIVQADFVSLESQQITEQIRMLEKFEFQVAEQLGIPAEDIDSVRIHLEAKNKALQDIGYSLSLGRLCKLHRLCLQYSHAQQNLPVDLELCPSPPGVPHRVDASRFWAILIGIDEYLSYPLCGCVSDVQLMERYLTEDLSVPSNRIQLLLGSKEHLSPKDPIYPSRAHIVGTLLSLITNSKIAHGDNIIIYYSGHSSYYPYHMEEDNEPEYIETLCPIDRDTPGENSRPVPDISNWELNMILSLIAQAKGHCITVILDCCHSSSVSRGLPEPGAHTFPPMTRATLSEMLFAGEKNLSHYPNYRSILDKDWHPDVDSHVILAACMEYQYAKAKPVKMEDGTVTGYIGIFTDSLVRALWSGHWRKETTYVDLLHHLDMIPCQTPVIAGNRKSSCIWYQG